jgi:DNA integrity scanning protein DisA with diadenylate cyclase activity
MPKIETQEIEVYKSQVSQLEQQATQLSITSPEENATAIELKATLDKTGKEIKSKKETITKPLNEALKNARALFAPLEEVFENADNIVGRKLLDYKRKIDADAAKQAAKIAADLESGKIKKLELVPDQYLIVDMVAVRRDALAGIQIPGVEVYEEETV